MDAGVPRADAGLLFGLVSVIAVPISLVVAPIAARWRSQSPWILGLGVFGLAGTADVPTLELASSQQRLVALAAALASEPQVLLVDELAAGAGAEELDLLVDAIDRIRDRGVAVLVVEHNLRLVRRVADRVLVLGAGTVVAEGSVAEVAASGVVQQAYLGTARL